MPVKKLKKGTCCFSKLKHIRDHTSKDNICEHTAYFQMPVEKAHGRPGTAPT